MRSNTKAPMLLEFTCSQRWQEMTGDERARHCAQCNQQVINISDYSQAQINNLQERIDCGEKICVAFRAAKPEPAEILGEWLPFSFSQSSRGLSGLLACSLTLGAGNLLLSSPALAEDGQKQESRGKGPVVPASGSVRVGDAAKSASQVPVESLKRQLRGAGSSCDVELESDEYEMMKGRPAPSVLRDTITDLIYQKDDFFNFVPMVLRFSIRQQLEKEGSINIPRVEWMAALQEFQGNSEQALNSYRLLLALSERQSAPPERKTELWKKIEALAPGVYKSYLKELGKVTSDETQVLSLLSKAHEVRTLSPAIKKLCSWSELASSIDRVGVSSKSLALASFALDVSSAEPQTQALKVWRKRYIDVLVRHFNECLDGAKKELANGRLSDVTETTASLYLPSNLEAAALCDAKELFRVRLKLIPLLKDEPRFRCLMDCINYMRSPAYHPREDKCRNQLSGLVVAEVRKRMVQAHDAMNKDERLQAVWRVWEAQALIKALPEAISPTLLKEVKESRRELKLKPEEEAPFK